MSLRMAVVDDDTRFRRLAVTLLRIRGFEVVADGWDMASGLEAMQREDPDVALIDFHLPDGTGLQLAEALVRCGLQVRVVLTSTDADALSGDLDGTNVVAFIPKDRLGSVDLSELFGFGQAAARAVGERVSPRTRLRQPGPR